MDPNAFAASPQVMRSGCTFTASLTNGAIRCGWLLTGRDQLCFDQVSRVGSDWFLPPPPNTQGPVMVGILPQKSIFTATYYVETVLPEAAAVRSSPRTQFHVLGTLRFMSLTAPFYSVLVFISVFMALSTIFHCINPPDNSLPSHPVLSSLISALLVLSTIHLFMKVFLSPDIILGG